MKQLKTKRTGESKVPKSWPTFIVKCAWDATATLYKVRAKDEEHALEVVRKKLTKTEGGEKCLTTVVKEVRWNTSTF